MTSNQIKKLIIFNTFIVLFYFISSVFLSYHNSSKIKDEFLKEYTNKIYNDKENEIKTLVVLSHDIINIMYSNYGKSDRFDYIVQAYFGNLRFHEDKSGYIFMYDIKGNCIVMPDKHMIGKNFLEEMKDNTGKYYLQELLKVADKGGFSEYDYPKPGASIPLPKISYVMMFEPLDIMIGSGVYLEDINNEINSISIIINNKIEESIRIRNTYSFFVLLIVLSSFYMMYLKVRK